MPSILGILESLDPGPGLWTQKCWTLDRDFGPKTHKICCYFGPRFRDFKVQAQCPAIAKCPIITEILNLPGPGFNVNLKPPGDSFKYLYSFFKLTHSSSQTVTNFRLYLLLNKLFLTKISVDSHVVFETKSF